MPSMETAEYGANGTTYGFAVEVSIEPGGGAYDTGDGFVGYVPTTNDPGAGLIVLTILVCVLSLLFLPCLVVLGRRYEAHRERVKSLPQKRQTLRKQAEDDRPAWWDVFPPVAHPKAKTKTSPAWWSDSSSDQSDLGSEGPPRSRKWERLSERFLGSKLAHRRPGNGDEEHQNKIKEGKVTDSRQAESYRPEQPMWWSKNYIMPNDVAKTKDQPAWWCDDDSSKSGDGLWPTARLSQRISKIFGMRRNGVGDSSSVVDVESTEQKVIADVPDNEGSSTIVAKTVAEHSTIQEYDVTSTPAIMAGESIDDSSIFEDSSKRETLDAVATPPDPEPVLTHDRKYSENESSLSSSRRSSLSRGLSRGSSSSDYSAPSAFIEATMSSKPRVAGPRARAHKKVPAYRARKLQRDVEDERKFSSRAFSIDSANTAAGIDGTNEAMTKREDNLPPEPCLPFNDLETQSEGKSEKSQSLCCSKNAVCRQRNLERCFGFFLTLMELDKESIRIIKLTVPLTSSQVMETVFDLLQVVLISQFLGIDSVTAAAMSDLFIGMTEELLGGLIDAQYSIMSHAIGAGNNFLAGQYVQVAVVTYTIASIPEIIVWWFLIEPLVLWFGFSENVARIAQQFGRVQVFNEWQDALGDSLHGIYEVTGHEVFSTVVGLVEGGFSVLATLLAVTLIPGVELYQVALLYVGTAAVSFAFSFIYGLKKGWLRPFLPGMFHNCALKERTAMRTLFKTAAPLSFGQLLAYGEWEVLTVFCAFLGPAEVATWALLGYVWEIFEASTEGIGDASEIRIAYHLGRGRPHRAKIAAYKCLVLAMILATLATSILFIIGNDLPRLLTNDPAIQHMMSDLIPLIGVGNLTMTYGMEAWALIGAQGRYLLATKVATISSWGVTIPLAALFVFGLNFDLQGLTSAVVIGYTFCGTILAYILIRSDWEKLSIKIQNINAITGETYSSDEDSKDGINDDDSDSSVSSQSSSSSSSSDEDAKDGIDDDDSHTSVSSQSSSSSSSSSGSRSSSSFLSGGSGLKLTPPVLVDDSIPVENRMRTVRDASSGCGPSASIETNSSVSSSGWSTGTASGSSKASD